MRVKDTLPSLYSLGEMLPGPMRSAVAGAYIGYARARMQNEVVHNYDRHQFRFKFADRKTLRKAINAVQNGEIGHEGVPISMMSGLRNDYDIAIDVGAHFGIYSVLIGVLNPDLPVICFEPNTYNRQVLKGNLAANNLKSTHVRIRKEPVSGETETVEFFEGPEGSVSHTMQPTAKHKDYRQTRKQAVSLSEICAETSSRRPWVKIDAEGSEDKILKDLLTADHIDEFGGFVELHLNRGHISVESISGLLGEHGYALEQVKDSPTNPGYSIRCKE